MRLRELLALSLTAMACMGACAQAEPAASSPNDAAQEAPVMTVQAVEAAASAVRADPLLPGREKTRSLRFKQHKKDDKPQPDPDLGWWSELLGSFSAGARIAVYLVGAALLILVLLRLRDWLLQRDGLGPAAAPLPAHVGSLDIRPESLPADIGAAARALWQRGDLRGALSLLYRGALSRLVHQHGVPIRAASTEGECLALASRRMAVAPQAYLAQLVSCWQAAAYAHRMPAEQDLEMLCAGFDAGLALHPVGSAA
ncbi:MAG TPA: DUF4129 domain-containing protein [Burkholderiaceae bacterium]